MGVEVCVEAGYREVEVPDCNESRGRSRCEGLDMVKSTGVGGPLEESEEIEPIARRGRLRGRLDT
jgi:hypothetical protein